MTPLNLTARLTRGKDKNGRFILTVCVALHGLEILGGQNYHRKSKKRRQRKATAVKRQIRRLFEERGAMELEKRGRGRELRTAPCSMIAFQMRPLPVRIFLPHVSAKAVAF